MYIMIMEISKVIIDDVYPPPRAIYTQLVFGPVSVGRRLIVRTAAAASALLSRDTTVLLQLL